MFDHSPNGTYSIRVSAPNFRQLRIEGIEITSQPTWPSARATRIKTIRRGGWRVGSMNCRLARTGGAVLAGARGRMGNYRNCDSRIGRAVHRKYGRGHGLPRRVGANSPDSNGRPVFDNIRQSGGIYLTPANIVAPPFRADRRVGAKCASRPRGEQFRPRSHQKHRRYRADPAAIARRILQCVQSRTIRVRRGDSGEFYVGRSEWRSGHSVHPSFRFRPSCRAPFAGDAGGAETHLVADMSYYGHDPDIRVAFPRRHGMGTGALRFGCRGADRKSP